MRAHGWGWRHPGRADFAVRGLDLEVSPGERVLLLGPSGAGKSTLLAGLAGLLAPSDETGQAEGQLLIDGQPAADQRGRAGLVLQDPQSQTILARCGDDVAFGCENLGVPRELIWPRVRQALAAVRLDVPLDRSTEHLSGGQRQRLALAGVLAMAPGLVLLDEPTANLDPGGVDDVRDAVRGVLGATGATLVVVEHRVEVWLDLVDRVVVLAPGGGVAADGAPAQVFDEHGERLAEAGVWVPGRRPPTPSRQVDPHRLGAAPLIGTRQVQVARPGGVPIPVGADLELPAGGCVAVVGANGAGKSTFGLTVAGLLPPVSGRVIASPTLCGQGREAARNRFRRGRSPDDPWTWRSRDLLTRIGLVFQDPEHQFLTPTVRSELLHGPLLAGVDEATANARTDELLDRLRLTAVATANPFTLSGGEKRRLSVATALTTRPQLLVLDEPTFGQDARTWAEVVQIIAGLLDGGVAALVVTHDEHVVSALADGVLTITGSPPIDPPAWGTR